MNPTPRRMDGSHTTSPVRALRRARFVSEVSAIHASWLSHLTGNGSGVRRRWSHVYECHARSTFHASLCLQQVWLRPEDSLEDSGVRTVTGFALGISVHRHRRMARISTQGSSRLHLSCEGFHTRGAVTSPSMCHAPLGTRSPLQARYPLPLRLARFPRLPCSGSCLPHTDQTTTTPARLFPTRHVGKVAQVFPDEPGRAHHSSTHHNPSRPARDTFSTPRGVPVPAQARSETFPHGLCLPLLMPARTGR